MSCTAVIVAAGEGQRFGTDLPKQFHPLDGIPVVLHSCSLLWEHPAVDGLVLVLPESVLTDPPGWMSALPEGVRTVRGGTTRTDSVRRGLAEVDEGTGTVLVHDAVRPLATSALVDRVREAARSGPAVPVVPVVDTVKRVDEDGFVLETVDRSRLRLVQTPQGFPRDVLERVLERAHRDGRAATDEAGLCEAYGIPVRTLDGDPRNLKITRPQDLELAEMILGRRSASARDRG